MIQKSGELPEAFTAIVANVKILLDINAINYYLILFKCTSGGDDTRIVRLPREKNYKLYKIDTVRSEDSSCEDCGFKYRLLCTEWKYSVCRSIGALWANIKVITITQ